MSPFEKAHPMRRPPSILLPALALITLAACQMTASSSSMKETRLFNSETLDGWHAVGDGTWTVEEGAIVGRADNTKLYGLLISDETYTNFTVSFRFKCISGDSGFYIRTFVKEPERAEGMQVQVGPVGSGNGGIYESYGRGWLSRPSTELEEGLVEPATWNQMTITATEGSITVHVNGTLTAELKEDTGQPNGHFGLQMHAGQAVHVMFKDITLEELPR